MIRPRSASQPTFTIRALRHHPLYFALPKLTERAIEGLRSAGVPEE